MSDIDKIIDSIQGLSTTLKAGFSSLSSEIQGTNQRVDGVNQRLDETNQRLDGTNQRLDETIQRLDKTNERLDDAILELRTFRRETGERFDGVGVYLRAINGTLLDHSEKLHNLETRLSKLEGKEGVA